MTGNSKSEPDFLEKMVADALASAIEKMERSGFEELTGLERDVVIWSVREARRRRKFDNGG